MEFLIGTSTSPHQVEGNNVHSDSWAQEHMNPSSYAEPSLDAVDHYRRYGEDIALMKKAKLNAYRFGIEWARIEPENGVFDEEEMNHYMDVIQCCRDNGIEPVVTLFHFSSPAWLIKEGGWENEKTVEYFERYVKYVISKIKDCVRYVCTINEANMGAQIAEMAESFRTGPQVGINIEEIKKRYAELAKENVRVFSTPSPQTFLSARTDKGNGIIKKCHVKAREAIRAANPDIKVGITLSLFDIQWVSGGENAAAKKWNSDFTQFTECMKGDDFCGVQNYTRTVFDTAGAVPLSDGARKTDMGYEFYPESLGHVVERVHKETGLPILVTENGVATENDDSRCEFITRAFAGLKNAIEKGVPVLGYLHWSTFDNFEWQKGYGMKFGVISVDRKTMERTPKKSLYLLGNLK